MSVAWEIRLPLVLVCLNLKISQEVGISVLNWDLFYENQDRGFQKKTSFQQCHAVGGAQLRMLQVGLRLTCTGGSYQTPLCLQHPPPCFSTSLSLALCPGGGQTLPSALLAKWNLYFSHILLGRWYKFFFFLFYFYILKIFPRLLESQASCFVLPGHILSDSILTAKA